MRFRRDSRRRAEADFCKDGILRQQSRAEQRSGVYFDRVPCSSSQGAPAEEEEAEVVAGAVRIAVFGRYWAGCIRENP